MKYLILVLLIAGCATTTIEEKVPEVIQQEVVDQEKTDIKPVEPEQNFGYTFDWGNLEWDRHLVDQIKNSKLVTAIPKDREEYFYSSAKDPIEFWGKLLVKMSYYESKWIPSKKYLENFKDRNGRRIYSRGLFQLSLESGRGYGCPFHSEADIHKPKNNITCAVKILERWVVRDGVIRGRFGSKWRGGARYWAVLRGTRKYTKISLNGIKNANKSEE